MFGCRDCTTKYEKRAGNFDITPNMKSGFSNRCKSCRIKWHMEYRKATHVADSIDIIAKKIIKINSRTISDNEAEKLLIAANNMTKNRNLQEGYSWSDLKIISKQLKQINNN